MERNDKSGICMARRNEDVAVLGIVVIFGIEHVEITATVGIYKLFGFGHPDAYSGLASIITREFKLQYAHGVVHPCRNRKLCSDSMKLLSLEY